MKETTAPNHQQYFRLHLNTGCIENLIEVNVSFLQSPAKHKKVKLWRQVHKIDLSKVFSETPCIWCSSYLIVFNKKSSKDIHPHLSYLDLHFIVSINFKQIQINNDWQIQVEIQGNLFWEQSIFPEIIFQFQLSAAWSLICSTL